MPIIFFNLNPDCFIKLEPPGKKLRKHFLFTMLFSITRTIFSQSNFGNKIPFHLFRLPHFAEFLFFLDVKRKTLPNLCFGLILQTQWKCRVKRPRVLCSRPSQVVTMCINLLSCEMSDVTQLT